MSIIRRSQLLQPDSHPHPSGSGASETRHPQHWEGLATPQHKAHIGSDANAPKLSLILSERDIELNLPQDAVALNGSITYIDGYTVLAYRLNTRDSIGRPSMQIAVVHLDDEFQPIGPTSILETRDDLDLNPTAEDPRLVVHLGRLFIVYNSSMDGKVDHTHRAIYLAEVALGDPEGRETFRVIRRKKLQIPSGQQRIEKNWTPFSTAGRLHFIYTTNPTHVFAMGEDEWQQPGSVVILVEVGRSKTKITEHLGQMRGGTAAIFDTQRGVFASFFHTQLAIDASEENPSTLYFAGLYTFSPTPPFEILEVLPFPIVPSRSYQDPKISLWATYPMGFIRIGDIVHLSYGQNDNRIGVVSLNYEMLMAFMRKVTYLSQPTPGL